MAYKRIGDILISMGLINDDQLKAAIEMQKKTKKRLGAVLIENGTINEKQLIDALVMHLGVEFIDLSNITIPPEVTTLLSKNIAQKYNVIPVKVEQDKLYLAMSDPLNFVAIEEVKTATRKRVIPMISTERSIELAILKLYGSESAAKAIEEMKRESGTAGMENDAPDVNLLETSSDAAPTIRFVSSIIERAILEHASDIHLDPHTDEMRVRMRIDGVMRNILDVPKNLQASVISRLKIMGGMDISERRVTQDGRASVRVQGKDYDLRMSSLPTIYGEKIVIRILDKSSSLLNKQAIGLTGDNLKKFEALMRHPSGVILIAGPTGSGKSSTMYTMIRELNTEQVNLITLEDPVEYNIAGINQVQINDKIGMTFSSGLRAILRQDPDIIAVGEIRDSETAQIAMRAAITGHMVLSTIHTNDALSTLGRLEDIGVEPYLLTAAMRGVIFQRLVRKVCPNCRKEYIPEPDDLRFLGFDPDSPDEAKSGKNAKFYRGEGCPMCFNEGYKGRTAVFEILLMTRDIKAAISSGATPEQLEATAIRSGFKPLVVSCRELVLEGMTSIDEIRRVLNALD